MSFQNSNVNSNDNSNVNSNVNSNLEVNIDNIKNTIYNLLSRYHNPNLVDIKQTPNENTIYHLYNDGEITTQKGSYAYGDRNERTYYDKLYNKNSIDINKFLLFRNDNINNKYGYIIATKKNCIEIRNLMLELN